MGDCIPVICSPTGPHDPFGTWYLAIFDTVRLGVIGAVLVLMFAIGMAWARSVPHGGQRDRYLGLAVFAITALGTEIENFGNIASYRLVLSAVGLVFSFRGLSRFRRELPAEPEGLPDAHLG